MNEENEVGMKQLSMFFCLVGLPFLVCGDFNMLSADLYNTGWPSFLKAVTVDVGGALSTLRQTDGRLIDFILVSEKIRGLISAVYLVPEFPTKPHYSFCLELHRSPRLVREPMLVIPRPLPMEAFKEFWRGASEWAQANLVNQARQIAKGMLGQQKLKSGVAILGFPLKEIISDPLIALRHNLSLKNGEDLALSCLTTELTVLLGANIPRKDRHKYIGRGQYPKVVNKSIVCKITNSRYVSEDLNIWGAIC